ncbi:nickel-dependent lactate racemase [uncultured Oscillibacter sp.]|uniref:nickel-dependent lactate racemase n=1 Tax=uncultured Oscillibacter sp. TaxID=876091 RepID=UPI00280B30EF|nr:nickel-dependent lactate racemase [uncultured Oscillibacter sp.]
MHYGKTSFPVTLAPEEIAAELEPNAVELAQKTVPELVRDALAHPIDSKPLKELVKPGESVCIIISDVTRRWQSPEIYIPIVVEELESAGIRDEDILILSATGTHRRQTPEEHMGLVTEAVYRRIRVEDHVCTDEDNLQMVGTTSYGTPVLLDKRALACDHIVLTGGVVYHFMAGFGGGRKSILPGIAGRETIMKNHNLALNPGLGNGSNPEVRSANMTDSNPVHADMMEACAMAKPSFLINVVVDDNQKIIGVFAGNWITAHRAACDLVDRMYGVPAKEQTELVIASAGGYPKDLNFYQTIKTLSNALVVAKEGGTIILVTKSDEGFGNDDTQRQIAGYETMLEREKDLRENFSIGAFIGYLFAEAGEKYNMIAVTDIPQADFGTAKIHVVSTLDEALELARQYHGGKLPRATLMPHGANTLPKMQ